MHYDDNIQHNAIINHDYIYYDIMIIFIMIIDIINV